MTQTDDMITALEAHDLAFTHILRCPYCAGHQAASGPGVVCSRAVVLRATADGLTQKALGGLHQPVQTEEDW